MKLTPVLVEAKNYSRNEVEAWGKDLGTLEPAASWMTLSRCLKFSGMNFLK